MSVLTTMLTVTAQAFGMGPTPSAAAGVAAGIFLTRNSILSLGFTGGYTKYGLLWSDYETTASSIGVHYKQFLGNSFYVKGGIDQRHIHRTQSHDDIFSGEIAGTWEFTANSTAVSIVIGNQWQWQNLTIGCDWIGYVQPLASQITNRSISDETDAIEVQHQEEDLDRYVRNGVSQGLRFYVGASF